MTNKIRDLKNKVELNNIYLVKYIALNEAKDGKPYLNIIFTDGSGDLEGRSWNDAERYFDGIKKGDFVRVFGKTNLFQGRLQVIIKDLAIANEDEFCRDDFIAKSEFDSDTMFQKLLSIVRDLDEVYIRDLLVSVLTDEEISRRLKTWAAGKSIHHAYQSGLLEHVLSCAELAVDLSSRYKVNTSYVVAGAILHDLCKVYELTDGVNVEYTEEGKLVGHLVKGVELIDRFSYKIKGFPYSVKLHLKHILLSHHGEYEYGSPKIPQTSEAMLVHLIDLMDSKMASFVTVKNTDRTAGHWSGFVKHLDRIVYKGDLPSFTSYEPPQKKKEGNHKKKELKQNLGSMLKDFKVDNG